MVDDSTASIPSPMAYIADIVPILDKHYSKKFDKVDDRLEKINDKLDNLATAVYELSTMIAMQNDLHVQSGQFKKETSLHNKDELQNIEYCNERQTCGSHSSIKNKGGPVDEEIDPKIHRSPVARKEESLDTLFGPNHYKVPPLGSPPDKYGVLKDFRKGVMRMVRKNHNTLVDSQIVKSNKNVRLDDLFDHLRDYSDGDKKELVDMGDSSTACEEQEVRVDSSFASFMELSDDIGIKHNANDMESTDSSLGDNTIKKRKLNKQSKFKNYLSMEDKVYNMVVSFQMIHLTYYIFMIHV